LLDPTSFNIVAVGRWNPMIITPDWVVMQGLAEAGEWEISLTPDGPKFGGPHFDWLSTATRLVVTANDPTEGVAPTCEFVAAVLERLAHTPVSALGVNIHVPLSVEGDHATGFASNFRKLGEALEHSSSETSVTV
jgi:hypothetical protein